MHAREFARRRALIEGGFGKGHGPRWARKAIRALSKRAGAIRIISQNRVIAYRMPNGSVACVKERFRNEAAAAAELGRIARTSLHAYIPVRAYCCEFCGGYHLTSRAGVR